MKDLAGRSDNDLHLMILGSEYNDWAISEIQAERNRRKAINAVLPENFEFGTIYKRKGMEPYMVESIHRDYVVLKHTTNGPNVFVRAVTADRGKIPDWFFDSWKL